MTPLYAASERGYHEIVQVLLETSANIDLADEVRSLMYNCTCPFLRNLLGFLKYCKNLAVFLNEAFITLC